MKRVFIIIPFLACLLCTSCIDILEEFFVNKDGSGRYVITYDLSSIMQPEFQNMLGGLAEMSGEETESEMNLNDLNNVELDSTISLLESATELTELSDQDKDLLSRSFMHTEFSGSSKIAKVTFEVNFNEAGEIKQFFELLEATDAGGGAEMGLPLNQFSTPVDVSIKKNLFKRFDGSKEELDIENDNSLAMMSMFFSEATYTSKYYFPKKVKKTTIDGAQIEGNVLTVENSFLDAMLSKVDISGEIKFK